MDEDLDALYDATCRATLARWANHPHVGDIGPRPFHPTKLSVTTGSFLGPLTSLSQTLSQIRRLVDGDPLADCLDPACLHFTFLALSQPEYLSADDLPDLTDVKQIFTRHCRGQSFALNNLRLVALPNALLIAGSPDVPTAARRNAFARDLLTSPWANRLRPRYPSGAIPPAFWHSTLVRYQADCLPERLRRFFAENRTVCHGAVFLPIEMLATNYNWQTAFRLEV